MTFRARFLFLCAALAAPTALHAVVELPVLWSERVKSVVAVEYVTESEIERRPTVSMGTVIDAKGTIILPGNAIDPRAATWQLKDFKVYLPGDATSTPGEYLGQDALSGWHFVARERENPRAARAGFHLRGEGRRGRAGAGGFRVGHRAAQQGRGLRALHHAKPPRAHPVAPAAHGHRAAGGRRAGLPVFDRDGAFVGIAASSFGQSFLQFSRNNRGSPVLLVNVEESSAFLLADEVLPFLNRIPKNISGRRSPGSAPTAWSRWTAMSRSS